MIKKAIEDAINEQIKSEFASAYVYLSMAAYCESANLPGFAHWMQMQSREETAHAMKMFDYLNDRGGRVILQALEQPPTEFKSPLDMMEQALNHEKSVSGMINQLYALAVKENDYATQGHLQWFVMEQVEEEKTAGVVVERLKLVGNHVPGLLMLDRELGARAAGS